jgi:hypothetical protein
MSFQIEKTYDLAVFFAKIKFFDNPNFLEPFFYLKNVPPPKFSKNFCAKNDLKYLALSHFMSKVLFCVQ